MRKFLMVSLLVGSSAIGFGGAVEAAPVMGAMAAPVASTLALAAPQQAQVETVQYRCGPRCRAERRRAYRHRHYRR